MSIYFQEEAMLIGIIVQSSFVLLFFKSNDVSKLFTRSFSEETIHMLLLNIVKCIICCTL